MLDTTGNNIANVNTVGFKSSAVQFQDTLSQLTKGAAGPQAQQGGANPAQIGLGVQVSAITTNFSQGSAQSTGKATDLMISGNGFFAVENGAETLYTRNGALDFDSQGRMVTAGGNFVQGWTAADGAVDESTPVGRITLPTQTVAPAVATTTATINGNLPSDAAVGTELTRDIPIYDANGVKTNLPLKFTRDAAGWTVNDGTSDIGTVTFTDGARTSAATITTGAGTTIDLTDVTGFAKMTTVAVSGQDGHDAGSLESYTIGNDGTVYGSFSNGTTEPIARIAIATFVNPGGLQKAGGSTYRVSANSGQITVGAAGSGAAGSLSGGYLEMSNVDLSQEFTNLIVAQRGFQANARIITTSDSVLEELTNLKR
jgi:flagellar hook protein FlgE